MATLVQARARRSRPRIGKPLQQGTVCHVLHGLGIGGAEVIAMRLARQLWPTYRFVFVCLDECGELGEQLQDEGFAVHVLRRHPGLDWRAALRLTRLLRQERVELVHAHQYTPFFYAAVARRLGPGVPVLFTEHGRHWPDNPRRKRILANRFLLGRRDRVVGVGQAVRDALIANEGLSPQRVEVIYNGIDPNPFASSIEDRRQARSQLGLGTEDLVVSQVARLDYLKDHATALRTLDRVRQNVPGARLLLVGDGPERGKIEEEARRLDLTAHLRLLGPRHDIARVLAAADIFLLTSISEGIPLTLIEAMSAALPVVATRVGGVGEVVLDGETGLLAPAGSDRELAGHVLELAASPTRRLRMGEAARARARLLFSDQRMHAEYGRLYAEMLDG